MRPLGDRVLVKVLERIKERSGILVVHRKKETDEPVLLVEVMAVGPRVEGIEKGQKALIAGYAGRWIGKDVIDEPETFRIVEEDEILAIVEEKVTDLNLSRHLNGNKSAARN